MYNRPPEGSGTCLPPAGSSNAHGCLYSQGRVGRMEKEEKIGLGGTDHGKQRKMLCAKAAPTVVPSYDR